MPNRIRIFMILASLPVLAQQPDWQAVRQIVPKSRVEIILHDGKRVDGRLVLVTPESLELENGRTVPREQIHRVQIREKQSRWRGAMIGSLSGFAVGFIAGASKTGYIADRNNPPASLRLGIGAGIGMYSAAIGAPIGALVGRTKSTTVYRAGKPW